MKYAASLLAATLALAVASPVVASCPLGDTGCYDNSYSNSYDNDRYSSNSRQEGSGRTRHQGNDWSRRDNISQHGTSNCGIAGCNTYERSPEGKRNITDYGIGDCGIAGC